MRAYRMGQLSSQAYMSHSTPAAKALLRGAAGVKEPENSLNRLYEVVRAQQPHEGCPLSAQQVELICNVIGKTAVLTCKQAGSHRWLPQAFHMGAFLAENIKLEDLGLNPSLGQVRQLFQGVLLLLLHIPVAVCCTAMDSVLSSWCCAVKLIAQMIIIQRSSGLAPMHAALPAPHRL